MALYMLIGLAGIYLIIKGEIMDDSRLELDVWVHVMVFVLRHDDVSLTAIAKGVDVTYSHIIKLVNHLLVSRYKFLSLKKVGRTQIVSLTPAGLEVAKHLEPVVMALHKVDGVKL